MVKITNFLKKFDLAIITIIVTILCIIGHMVVVKKGGKAGDMFSDNSLQIIVRDTTIGLVKTAVVYDKVSKIGVIVHPAKYKDIYLFNRITSQLKTIKHRAMAHDRAIDYFIINLYYFITIQILFMIIVLVLGVIISKKGWGDSPDKLLGGFLIAAGFLLFFQIYPKGTLMNSNLTSNKNNYKLYCSVENNILTYLATEKTDENFVRDIDVFLKDYHAISFDLEEVPFSEVRDQFDEIRKASEGDRDDSKPKLIYVPTYVPSPTSKSTEPVNKMDMKSMPEKTEKNMVKDSITKVDL